MADYITLKTAIREAIYSNGNEEITGDILQGVLLDMVDALGLGSQYAGVAETATDPGLPDENLFYLAGGAGTYTHFDNIVVYPGELALLRYSDGGWSKDAITISDAGAVRYDGPQSLEESEKQQARGNIEAMGYDDIIDSLTSTATDKALSANQGKVLNESISGKQDQLTAGENISISDNVISAEQVDIVDNLESSAADKALSANQGKVLNELIAAISGIGKYLAIWDCTTGLATSTPPEMPYDYENGMFFLVGKVAEEGGTNYIPNGAQYDGTPSTTPYTGTDELQIGDAYRYDDTTWSHMKMRQPGYDADAVHKTADALTAAQVAQVLLNFGWQVVENTGIDIDGTSHTWYSIEKI